MARKRVGSRRLPCAHPVSDMAPMFGIGVDSAIHLAQRSRDFQRLGGAYGSNHPPTNGVGLQQVATTFEQREMVGVEGGDC